MTPISKKICMIGDFGVGKTSLIRRFVDRQFSDDYLSTVGVKISRKIIEITGVNQQEKLNLQLLIWDLEGHTKFKAIAPSYLQGSSGAIIVADVSRIETLERLPEHIQLFLSINPKSSFIIALNKSDLIDEEKLVKLIEFVQLQEGVDKVSVIYQTSAKTGLYVDDIFQQLAHKSIESL
jgi:small GTP-binding protein